MTPGLFLIAALCICSVYYLLSRQRAYARTFSVDTAFTSRPHFHGWWAALMGILPAFVLLGLWLVAGPSIIETLVLQKLPLEDAPQDALAHRQYFAQVASVLEDRIVIEPSTLVLKGATLYSEYQSLLHTVFTSFGLASCFIGGLLGLRQNTLAFQAQAKVEVALKLALLVSSVIAVLTTFAIVLSLVFESLLFFGRVPMSQLFGFQWNPQSPTDGTLDADIGSYGVIPLFVGTLLISAIAMVVAVPIGLMSAIYLSQYASKRFRAFSKPLLEILAGIPTVVYGFFAALVVAPIIRSVGTSIGLDVAAESALAAGLVMGVMIIPFMSSLSDDAISAVPRSIGDASLALGATRAETVSQVLLPAALPGIIGAILLAISRAIGETMIVVMAAGLAAHMSINPLDSVTTVTVQIVKLLTGDQAFQSAKTLSAFALGLMLFCMTLAMNAVALFIVRRNRDTYE